MTRNTSGGPEIRGSLHLSEVRRSDDTPVPEHEASPGRNKATRILHREDDFSNDVRAGQKVCVLIDVYYADQAELISTFRLEDEARCRCGKRTLESAILGTEQAQLCEGPCCHYGRPQWTRAWRISGRNSFGTVKDSPRSAPVSIGRSRLAIKSSRNSPDAIRL